jgi:hypothetical protein
MRSRPTHTLEGQIFAMHVLEIYRPFDKPEFTDKREFSHKAVLSSKAIKGVEIAE